MLGGGEGRAAGSMHGPRVNCLLEVPGSGHLRQIDYERLRRSGQYSRQGTKGRKKGDFSLSCSGDYLFPHRIEDNFSGTMEIQLLHDVGAMRLDGVGADVEGRGDFLVGFALRQKLQDLLFTVGE